MTDSWPSPTPTPPPLRKPPRKWEAWAVGVLFLLYFSGISNPDEEIAKNPFLDLFLIVAVGWLIAVLIRLRKFRRQVGNP